MALNININLVAPIATIPANTKVADIVVTGGTAPYNYTLATGSDSFSIDGTTVKTKAEMTIANIASFSVLATDSASSADTVTSGVTYPAIESALALKMTKANIIYKITRHYDLGHGTLTIPAGCTLDFQGGSFSNGNLIFSNTYISGQAKIFTEVSGSIQNEAIIDWFINNTISIKDSIRRALSIANKIIFSKTTYNINDSIVISSNKSLIGNGATINSNSANDLFVIENNARFVEIAGFNLYGTYNSTTSKAAIKLNADNGGADHYFHDMIIVNWYYGLNAKNNFWESNVQNIRFNSCGYAVYIDGNGQCINNTFTKISINDPIILGILISGSKNTTFYSCNNGALNTNSFFLQVQGVCYCIYFIGCNFEGNKVSGADKQAINILSSSTVMFKSCTFVNITNDVGATASSMLKSRDTSEVILEDCQLLTVSTNSILNATNTSTIKYTNVRGNLILKKDNGATLKLLIPKTGKTESVDNSTFIATELGRYANSISFTLQTQQAVTANIDQVDSSGAFKLKFYNISDGTVNTNPNLATVYWSVD